MVRQHEIRFAYRGEVRTADPWGVVDKDDVWYLVAGTPAGRRTFRVDRVLTAELTDSPADRPAGLHLAAVWEEEVAELEGRRSVLAATVLVPDRLVPVLQGVFGRHCTPGAVRDDGRREVRVAAHTVRSVAEQLAGLGGAVEVVAPEEVRAELARVGAELVERHSR